MSGALKSPQPREGANHTVITGLFEATNDYAIDAAMPLFSTSADIDDPSVGRIFKGHSGVGEYLTTFFVGYQTRTTILSADTDESGAVHVRADFTGTFGHEIGILRFTFDDDGLILRLHADLEG